MSTIKNNGPKSKPSDARTDLREQLFNDREIGPIEQVQLPEEAITTLHAVLFDLDTPNFRSDRPGLVQASSARKLYTNTIRPMLTRHPALAGARVLDTGRGLHVVVVFDQPVRFETERERERFSGIIEVVQAALPIDPHQPGITALSRPVGSVNSKTDRPVKLLKEATPVPIAEVLRLYDQMDKAPFRTVTEILLGALRLSPCPICRADGSSLSALDRVGQCYVCGTINLDQIYDIFLRPRSPQGKDATDASR